MAGARCVSERGAAGAPAGAYRKLAESGPATHVARRPAPRTPYTWSFSFVTATGIEARAYDGNGRPESRQASAVSSATAARALRVPGTWATSADRTSFMEHAPRVGPDGDIGEGSQQPRQIDPDQGRPLPGTSTRSTARWAPDNSLA